MHEKKDPYKFTIQFNPSDPTHQQTAVLLNRQGRRKAQFLVNAVMHYIDIPQEPPVDTALIETIVRKVLKEQSEEPQIKKTEKHHPSTVQAPEDDFSSRRFRGGWPGRHCKYNGHVPEGLNNEM